jgi:predicted ATP-binding protein involved in virulence
LPPARGHFSPGFNVIIGDNGTGKTTVIEACATLLSSIEINNLSLGKLDIKNITRKIISYTNNSLPSLESSEKSNLRFRLNDYSEAKKHLFLSTHEFLNKLGLSTGLFHIPYLNVKHKDHIKIFLIDNSDLNRYEDVIGVNQMLLDFSRTNIYPIISKYSTNRKVESYNSPVDDILSSVERMSVYQNWSNIAENTKQNHLWLKTLEISSLQRQAKNPILASVKSAIKNCMADDQPGEVYYDILLNQICIKDNSGEPKPLDFLSDGQQSMMSMVMDLAIRAAILNPHLDNPPAETPGIVLIDELDLHLHPKWQRRIVDDLRRTFPKMQFIATTHSPLIIQSLRPGELIDLNDSDTKPDYEYSGRTPEDILEDGMGVEMPERSHKWQEMYKTAQEYYALLEQAENLNGKDEKKKTELREKLDVLMIRHQKEDPAFAAYTAFLQQKRLASGIDSP